MSTAIIRLPDDTAIDTDNPFPVTLQSKLMTDATGLNSRLRVDPGQTGFFAGRKIDPAVTGDQIVYSRVYNSSWAVSAARTSV